MVYLTLLLWQPTLNRAYAVSVSASLLLLGVLMADGIQLLGPLPPPTD